MPVSTVAICDTEPIAIEGIRCLLEANSGPRVVSTELTIEDGVEAVRELRPSLLLMDRAFGSHLVMDCLRVMRSEQSPTAVVVWGSPISESEALRYVQEADVCTSPFYPTPILQSTSPTKLVEYMSLVTTSVGYSVIAPPGVPDPIIDALRTAFDATMKDPAFLAAAKKCCVDLNPANHEVVAGAVAPRAGAAGDSRRVRRLRRSRRRCQLFRAPRLAQPPQRGGRGGR